MGDLIRKVTVWAVSPTGDPGESARYRALVDTGSTKTVIPKRILDDLDHEVVPGQHTFLRGERVPVALVLLQIHADAKASGSCEPRLVVAAVSSAIAKQAGDGADLILGHDYLQEARAVLRYGDRHTVSCVPAPLKQASRSQRRRTPR